MRQQVFPSDVVLPIAEAAATRLCRRLGLPPCDCDDLRQQLLVDLIRRLQYFDPARGSLGAFAGVVMRHESARLATRVMVERQSHGGPLLSLDAPTADGRTLGDALSNRDGFATWHGNRSGALVEEQRLDVKRVLATLDRRDRALCTAVAYWPVDRLAERGFGSRAGLYRRLRELRHVLAAKGLRAA